MPRGAFKRGSWQRLLWLLISVIPYYTISYTHPTPINVLPRGSKKHISGLKTIARRPNWQSTRSRKNISVGAGFVHGAALSLCGSFHIDYLYNYPEWRTLFCGNISTRTRQKLSVPHLFPDKLHIPVTASGCADMALTAVQGRRHT